MSFRSWVLMTLHNFLSFVAQINFTFTFISLCTFWFIQEVTVLLLLRSLFYRSPLVIYSKGLHAFHISLTKCYLPDSVLDPEISHVHIVKQAIYVVEVILFFFFLCVCIVSFKTSVIMALHNFL